MPASHKPGPWYSGRTCILFGLHAPGQRARSSRPLTHLACSRSVAVSASLICIVAFNLSVDTVIFRKVSFDQLFLL